MNLFKLFRQYWRFLKKEKRTQLDLEKQSQNSYGHFTLYNWWSDGMYLWFVRRYQNLLDNADIKVNFCSVFGQREVLASVLGKKIFFSGENIHRAPFDEYADYLLFDKTTSLGLGFDYFDDARYLRFPLWIIYMFKPNSLREDIVERCNELRYPDVSRKSHFCSMVASHDPNGLRKSMVKSLNTIEIVSCAGKYLHNDDSLKKEYNDNKINYLKDFYFNICPENSNSSGYVTEKLFESISAGCVPIYWGSYNNPEPLILNQEAIIFWNKEGNNDDAISKIERMYSFPDEMKEFLNQPRLLEGAEDVIWEMFEKLDSAIIQLLKA